MSIQAASGSVPPYADRYENLALTRDDRANRPRQARVRLTGDPTGDPTGGRADATACRERHGRGMENEQHGRKPAAQQVRVLIVDPHASFRSAIKALLQTARLAVVADFEHCEGAEDVAAALHPDVMLIDVSPLQTDGLELARRLSVVARPPAIVLMSATPSEAILAESAGADLFLSKAGITARAIAHAARKPRS